MAARDIFEDDLDPWGDDPDGAFVEESADAPEAAATSRGRRFLFGCLAISGVFGLLCCGGGVFVFLEIRDQAVLDESPEAARAALAGITDFEIPPDYSTVGTSGANLWVFKVEMVFFAPPGSDGMLLIVQSSASDGGGSAMQSALQQRGDVFQELTIAESQTRSFKINDQTSPFQFSKGKDDSGRAFRQVTGEFKGKSGTAVLMLQVLEENWNEDAVVKMLESAP